MVLGTVPSPHACWVSAHHFPIAHVQPLHFKLEDTEKRQPWTLPAKAGTQSFSPYYFPVAWGAPVPFQTSWKLFGSLICLFAYFKKIMTMTITQNRWLCQSTSFWPQQKLYCGRALWRDPGAFQLTACSQGERPTPNIMVSDLGSIRSHICAGFSGAALFKVTGAPMFTLSTPSFCSTAGHPSPPSSWARHFSPSKHSFSITSHNRGVSHVTHANDT